MVRITHILLPTILQKKKLILKVNVFMVVLNKQS